MSVTIYDIAREAGVGVGTVSRVLNNHPSVSAKSKERVLDVADRLQYVPNAAAQRLARRKSRTVTIIMPHISNNYFVELLGGVQDKLYDEDYDMLLYGVNQPQQLQHYLRRAIRAGHSDGLLIASLDLPSDFPDMYVKRNFPIVLLDRHHPSFDCFHIDNVSSAYEATRYLISLGHNAIAMISGNNDSSPSIQRARGYSTAIAEHTHVSDGGIHHPGDDLRNDGFNRNAGHEVMSRLLRLSPAERPTAVFAASDIQAIGALHAMKESGLRCPEDISIIGFDDIDLARYYDLTTMRQPIRRLGKLGIERLFRRMEDASLPIEQQQFTPELVIRRTTAPPPSRFPVV
jgi:LacI family transcriptional regulator